MRALAVLLVLLVLLVLPATARAEDEPSWHGFVAAGGALPIGGPSPGVVVGAGLSRHRFGVKADVQVFDVAADDPQYLTSAGLTYELGRTRHHLVMTAHAGGGVRFPEPTPILIGGLHTQLGLMRNGPLFLGADLALHVDLGSLPLDVYAVASLAVGLAF